VKWDSISKYHFYFKVGICHRIPYKASPLQDQKRHGDEISLRQVRRISHEKASKFKV
jgi:hypothetical protein